MTISPSSLFSRCLRGAACILLVLAPLAAQSEREVEAVETRIREMARHAEELRALGRHEEAEEVSRRVAAMRETLHKQLAAQRERRERAERGEQEEILHGLEQGMLALRRLGRHDVLEMVERIADEVRAARREHEHPEVREARRQLEVLRVALAALREAERRDAAERMELAIRARELGLEGRRDEEAQALRRRAPDRGQLVELLRSAAELWAAWGHERRAEATADLAERMMRRDRPRGERRRGDEREHVEHPREHGEHEGEHGEHERESEHGLADRVRRLEQRLERIERALERLVRDRERRDR